MKPFVVRRFIDNARTLRFRMLSELSIIRVLSINRRTTNMDADPLDAFVGAFHLGNDDPGWIERHDEYFVYDEGEHQKE